jgi:hypothetical protein
MRVAGSAWRWPLSAEIVESRPGYLRWREWGTVSKGVVRVEFYADIVMRQRGPATITVEVAPNTDGVPGPVVSNDYTILDSRENRLHIQGRGDSRPSLIEVIADEVHLDAHLPLGLHIDRWVKLAADGPAPPKVQVAINALAAPVTYGVGQGLTLGGKIAGRAAEVARELSQGRIIA